MCPASRGWIWLVTQRAITRRVAGTMTSWCALALRSGDCLLMLLSADVLGFTVQAADALRAEVARHVRAIPLAIPITEIAVTLAATHTHSAPASQPLRGCGAVSAAWQ